MMVNKHQYHIYHNSLNIEKTTTYDFEHPGPGMGQAHKIWWG